MVRPCYRPSCVRGDAEREPSWCVEPDRCLLPFRSCLLSPATSCPQGLAGNPGRQIGWACRCGARLPSIFDMLVRADLADRVRHLTALSGNDEEETGAPPTENLLARQALRSAIPLLDELVTTAVHGLSQIADQPATDASRRPIGAFRPTRGPALQSMVAATYVVSAALGFSMMPESVQRAALGGRTAAEVRLSRCQQAARGGEAGARRPGLVAAATRLTHRTSHLVTQLESLIDGPVDTVACHGSSRYRRGERW